MSANKKTDEASGLGEVQFSLEKATLDQIIKSFRPISKEEFLRFELKEGGSIQVAAEEMGITSFIEVGSQDLTGVPDTFIFFFPRRTIADIAGVVKEKITFHIKNMVS